MESEPLDQLKKLEFQFLQAYFNGDIQRTQTWVNKAVEFASSMCVSRENQLIICRVLLSKCHVLVLSSNFWEMCKTKWMEINLLAIKVYETTQHEECDLELIHLKLKALCYLGWSEYFTNKLAEAIQHFTLGRQNSSLLIEDDVLAEFGNLKNESSWNFWLRKCYSRQRLMTESRQGMDTLRTHFALYGERPSGSTSCIKNVYTKDWNAIEKELDLELKEDEIAQEKFVGEEAFQNLLKTIYRDSDEDTRRAMNKSYQLSAGAVLSTNWEDVKNKTYGTVRIKLSLALSRCNASFNFSGTLVNVDMNNAIRSLKSF